MKNNLLKIGTIWFVIMLAIVGVFTGEVKISDLLGIEKVNAAVAQDWATVYAGKNFNNVTQAWIANCTSSGCSSVDAEINSIGSSMGNTGAFIGNQNALTIGSNGVMVAYSTNTRLAANYMYSISTYVCSNKNLTDVTKHPYIGSSSSDVFNKNIARYYAISSAGLSGEVSTTHTFNYCYSMNTLIVPNETSSVIGINLHTSPSISGAYVYILGYNIDSLGLYTEEVRDIVRNAIGSSTSGLATTSQLNNATNQIKQEQQNQTNRILNEDNEYEDGSEDFDKSKMEEQEQLEENIMNQLDSSQLDNVTIGIGTDVSNFIWNIIERIKNINPKISMLFLSILGIGLIKMVLNR